MADTGLNEVKDAIMTIHKFCVQQCRCSKCLLSNNHNSCELNLYIPLYWDDLDCLKISNEDEIDPWIPIFIYLLMYKNEVNDAMINIVKESIEKADIKGKDRLLKMVDKIYEENKNDKT